MNNRWLTPILIISFVLSIVAIAGLITRNNDGSFVYPLDDTYIHMAMAKNMARHGTWGVGTDGFTSTSSSILWTLSLSLIYRIFGISVLAPLILNTLLAILLILILLSFFRASGLSGRSSIFAVIAVIVFAPVIVLVFCGIEHVGHALLTISFAGIAARFLSSSESSSKSGHGLILMAPLLAAVRYEGLFIIFIVSALFLLKRRMIPALLLALSAITPILLYGLISLKNGWAFLPNSVLLKGRYPELATPGAFLYYLAGTFAVIKNCPHLSVLFFLSLLCLCLGLRKARTLWNKAVALNLLFIGALVLHLFFARLGWFYRYEGYLVGLGTFAIFIGFLEILPGRAPLRISGGIKIRRDHLIWISLLILLTAVPGLRGIQAVTEIPKASRNIYEQQFQMGRFLNKYYNNESVAANDIGAINFYADIRCVDLWGTANSQVLRAKNKCRYDTGFIKELAARRGAKIALLYDEWFVPYGGLPPEWVKVGTWTILFNIICGDETVTFYAVDPKEKTRLADALKEYSAELPRRVIRKYWPR